MASSETAALQGVFTPMTLAERLVTLEQLLRRSVKSERTLVRALQQEFGDRPPVRDALDACDQDLGQLSLHLLRAQMLGSPVDRP
ncbi:hypothetical protein K7W42_12970 [Deinococcus sp. HMF7604]|uniref:hypothetical protein n=1 Tax=Deinococcus betulae TaxID=2873312 RepID=UPI001CCE9C94|nr:hypothetical protein [Deinococcus betulae]MBZ9751769.1 hypothetical protein [Deinococcus betulae]